MNAGTPSRTREWLGGLWRDKVALVGAVVIVVVVVVAIFAPWLAPQDPHAQSLSDRLLPPFWMDGGSSDHLFGTDNLGRDVLSRVMYGSRASLLIGFVVVVIAAIVGVAAGVLAGFIGGRVDAVVGMLIDTQLAFPGLLMVLVVFLAMGPGIATVIVVLVLSGWVVYARLVRSVVLSVKEVAYVDAGIVAGSRSHTVLRRHVLPALTTPVLTYSVLDFARVVLAESALSFLGLGLQPPSISWGLDIAQGRTNIFNSWWLVAAPGLALTLTVLSLNLVAGWARLVADPQQRDKRFVAHAESTL